MSDPDLILKKLTRIESCVRVLREQARPADLERDEQHRAFVEHTLQISIQAAIDAGSHVVAEASLGEPRTSRDVFTLLARGGWIETALARSLERMVGFRNVLVHDYDDVDLDVVRHALAEGLGDLESFARSLRARIAG